MLASTTCGSRSVAATRKEARERWKAPWEESSAPLQCCGSSTKKSRGSGVVCAKSRASAAKGAPPSPLRRPCMSFETVATSRFECWWPSCRSGSEMQRSERLRVSLCFMASVLSKMMNPASDTLCATCCQAAGSLCQSQAMGPLPTSAASSKSVAQRSRSKAFCASLASSMEASCASLAAAPRRLPLPPRPRPRPPIGASDCCFTTRSAAQRRKNTDTFDAVRRSLPASLSFCFEEFFALSLATSPCTRRAASTRRSTTLGRIGSSTRGHAWRRAKRRENDSSPATSKPPDLSRRPMRESSALFACCWVHSSTGGKSWAHKRPSLGCASNSSGLNGSTNSRIAANLRWQCAEHLTNFGESGRSPGSG
mmetsp:Transcript_35056/g.88351  ORF Transcript_35056/g.88351 Transcript_35056/m.88351 type:complete len:367 (-) Transcript_35056:52-1152(-)